MEEHFEALLYDSSDSNLEVYNSECELEEEDAGRLNETLKEEQHATEDTQPSSDNTLIQKPQNKAPDPQKIAKRSKRIKRRRQVN